jgi:hypothetical protein
MLDAFRYGKINKPLDDSEPPKGGTTSGRLSLPSAFFRPDSFYVTVHGWEVILGAGAFRKSGGSRGKPVAFSSCFDSQTIVEIARLAAWHPTRRERLRFYFIPAEPPARRRWVSTWPQTSTGWCYRESNGGRRRRTCPRPTPGPAPMRETTPWPPLGSAACSPSS